MDRSPFMSGEELGFVGDHLSYRSMQPLSKKVARYQQQTNRNTPSAKTMMPSVSDQEKRLEGHTNMIANDIYEEFNSVSN